jgi:hypothetical protein
MASPAADAALNSSVDGSTVSAQTHQQDEATAAAQCQLSGASSSSRMSGSTRRSKSVTLYAANSIGHHYFGSQQQLEVIAEPSKMTGSESAQQEVDVEPPPRTIVRTKLYINSIVLAVLAGVLVWSYYNNIRDILTLQRWYALIMLGVIPIGIAFFAFAINTAVSGVFHLIMGEWQGRVCTAEQSRSSSSALGALPVWSHTTCCWAAASLHHATAATPGKENTQQAD